MPGTLTCHHYYYDNFGSRLLKIHSLDSSFNGAHILRTLFNIQAREGSSLDGASQKTSDSKLLIFWLLFTGFYCMRVFTVQRNAQNREIYHTLW